MKLSILIPAYNEENTIGDVIDEIPKNISGIDQIEIIVVDDGSNDKTALISQKKGANVYSFTRNRGLAKAISFGFSKSIENGTDILIILDADNQYDSKEIPKILHPILDNKADIVLGDRQLKKLDHMSKQKKIGNRLASKVLSFVIGQKIHDGQTGFRAFNLEALKRLHIFSGYTYTQETIMQAKFKGLKIVEIPVAFRKRNDESRLISNIGSYAIRTLTILVSTIIFYKAVKFFGIISIIFMGFGIGFSIFMINHFLTTGMIRPHYGALLLGVFFLITGAISILMVIISSISKRQSILLEEILYKLRTKKPDR